MKCYNKVEGGGCMTKRLTRKQMAEQYPNQYLGITNIRYENNDDATIESAEVVYTDKSEEELLTLQISGKEDIMCWYTTGNRYRSAQ
jgi:hypothetical protein